MGRLLSVRRWVLDSGTLTVVGLGFAEGFSRERDERKCSSEPCFWLEPVWYHGASWDRIYWK